MTPTKFVIGAWSFMFLWIMLKSDSPDGADGAFAALVHVTLLLVAIWWGLEGNQS